ncbi:MAG: GAF domain-containing sensor histidine kinase [Chloroflexi bacterium]|nr:MAG: GAF domain-containing sensor histidine kinase [Chloroflexota bacterium]TMG66621.1 MAG: GAF domain-containing sensor histidine kinase [Chloroflexota bacterium]
MVRIGNAASPEELFEMVLEAAHEAVGYESASLMTVDPAGDALMVRAARGVRLEGTRVTVGPSISWQALERREAIILEGPANTELGTTYTKDVPFAICLPLMAAAKTLGVLNVNRKGHPGNDGVSFLRILSDQCALAIERMELYGDLQHFTGQLLSQEEEQRRRLARDLHDGLAPILVSAHAQLQSANVENEQVDKATQLLRRAIRETREILGTVRPATLDDLGLVAALSAAAREMADDAGWTLEEALDDPGPLSREAESTLYRVAVEALNNVKKHAAAHEVRLALLKTEDTLEIDVADDGHGFETEQWGEAGVRPGHFGLLGMRERVAFLGGLCKVQSRRGEGTTIRIVVPRDRLR